MHDLVDLELMTSPSYLYVAGKRHFEYSSFVYSLHSFFPFFDKYNVENIELKNVLCLTGLWE